MVGKKTPKQATPPKLSQIIEKNWSTKAKPFLKSHLWYKVMLRVWSKSWEPFRIYLLTSTANPVIICEVGLDWLCLVKAVTYHGRPFLKRYAWVKAVFLPRKTQLSLRHLSSKRGVFGTLWFYNLSALLPWWIFKKFFARFALQS